MFSKSIGAGAMQLTSAIANFVFPNIVGSEFNGDATWVATMRALLGKRIPENSRVRFEFCRSTSSLYRLSDVRDIYMDQIGELECDNILLYSYESTQEANETALKKYDEIMPTHGFEPQADLREFFRRRKIDARFFVNKDNRCTLIVTAGVMNYSVFHCLQIFMARYTPWYFENNPPTNDDQSLLKALTSNYSAEYEAIIETYASRYDFRSHAIKNVIGGFEKRLITKQKRAIESRIKDIEYELEHIMDNYARFVKEFDEKQLMLTGIETKIASGLTLDELTSFFIANKNLIPLETSSDGFSFIVNTYLTNYDPTAMKKIGENPYSHFYEGYTPCAEFESVADRKLLLDALFSRDPKMKMRMCAFFWLDGVSVHTQSRYTYPHECDTYMPNPHLDNFSCFGNNAQHIVARLRAHDYVGAVIQCIGTTSSVNLAEGASTKPMCAKMFSECSKKKFIELMDGTLMTPIEALQWLKSQQVSESNTTEEVTNNGQTV